MIELKACYFPLSDDSGHPLPAGRSGTQLVYWREEGGPLLEAVVVNAIWRNGAVLG